ncbi:MAG: tyrosine-type recombinase/integrase [Candidatus Atribacteria bacterium]|nr:tyrosine-type recombinase/integrase [Candidatus Atribacteria bacterium]
MNENKSIHEAIEYIIASLQTQGQAPGTLKNYRNSFSVFEKYLNEQKISQVDEEVCLEYVYLKTGMKLNSFNQKTLDPNINRRMKPLHLLLMYLDKEKFLYQPRKIKEPFICPEGFCDEYGMFMEECRRREYANATFNSNISKVEFFLKYLDSAQVSSSDEITLKDIGKFLALYDSAAVKYVGVILYVLRNYLSFIYHNGFTCCDFSLLLPKVRIMRNSSIPHSWKKTDVLKLLRVIDREDPKGKRDYAIILMTVRLGLRVSDIRAMKLSSLNWNRKTISLNMIKTKQAIELPLLDDIGWAVIDYLKNGRPKTCCDDLFIRHRPPYNDFVETSSFHESLRRYMLKANLSIPLNAHHGMHSLRSSLAKNMLEAQTPLPVISEILGHQNINTTSFYLKIDIEGLRKCALDPEEVFLVNEAIL